MTLQKKVDEDGGRFVAYLAVYEYWYNETLFKQKSEADYGETPPVGSPAVLLIDPKNPDKFYEIERESYYIKKHDRECRILAAVAAIAIIAELIFKFF